jgi:glucose/arabinose dehydrogenase
MHAANVVQKPGNFDRKLRVKRWMLVLIVLPAFAAEPPKIALEPFVSNVEFPVDVQHDGTKRLYVVEQRGRIRLVVDGQLQSAPYLDIRDRVKFGGECGLLGLAFHPDFARNGRYFVNYTTTKDEWPLTTRISQFHDGVERVLLRFRQPYANHNGGGIVFGPDKKLYIGTGDGGSAGDPHNNAQNLHSLLGKMLTLDVDEPGAQPEIYAYGLRNPWRFSFDPLTKLLYAADVGQDKWEEIDIIERGKNYGWRIREGLHRFSGEPSREPLVDPIKEYGHDVGLSIIGGYVYRGKRFPALVGWYIYGDYDSGRIWGLKYENGRVTGDAQLLQAPVKISSFGQDVDGELYVCSHYDNAVLRLMGM